VRILSLCNVPLDESLGSGYVALRYARGLRERGHHVDAFGPSDYEILPHLTRAIRYRQTLGMARATLRLLPDGDYDIVELWGGEAWLSIAWLTRVPGRRFLVVLRSNGLETHCLERMAEAHGEGFPAPDEKWFHLDQTRFLTAGYRRADALVTVADFDRRYALLRHYAPPRRILAVDNPLPDDYLGLPVDFARPPVIGFCGTWLPRKGTELITAALPPFLRRFPQWRLTLVGVGGGFRAEEHFPADVLPRITVVPFAARNTELRALYQSFAVLLLPSLYESFGLAASEAMACGAALVATQVGFAAGLSDREEAFLLPAPSPEALLAALESACGDERLRRSVAQGGYQRVQTLRWDAAVDTVEAAYHRWLREIRNEV
jgi:glycosyltransferase involved in cell wall biosynthesis